MNCDEIQQLYNPHLDSELDARTAVEIEQHLATCAACTGLFVEQEKLDVSVAASLSRGQRTPALWERIERSVAVASSSSTNPGRPVPMSPVPGWRAVLAALRAQVRAGLRPSPRAWAGLAAVWCVILVLNLAAREPAAPPVIAGGTPSASEMRFALRQKQLLMAELALRSEPTPADRPKTTPPGPRSDRQSKILNA